MNIFAEELILILQDHGKELSWLFNLREDIPPSVVVRLKSSLSGNSSASLNEEQINRLQEKLLLSDFEMFRLHSALMAEAVRRMLCDRQDLQSAYITSRKAFRLFLQQPEGRQIFPAYLLVIRARMMISSHS